MGFWGSCHYVMAIRSNALGGQKADKMRPGRLIDKVEGGRNVDSLKVVSRLTKCTLGARFDKLGHGKSVDNFE